MITIKEVKTKKDKRIFLNFPLKLYKDNPYFVPPLYMDEKKIFKKRNSYSDTCVSTFYLAYKDGIPSGRIQGIIQKKYNEIHNEKRVRFTRFDSIDDSKVAKALFDKLTLWAKNKGMNKICGPLGYSDLEREGLLIHGFDEVSTFEEQYNFPYYQKLIEDYGFKKEVDWTESRLTYNDKYREKINKLSDLVMKKYNLHIAYRKPHESKKKYINRLAPEFFRVLDEAYKELYGVVPFNDKMKKEIIDNFKLLLDPKYLIIVLDSSDRALAFGLCFPAISEALIKTDGKLKLSTIIKLTKVLKNPKGLDLGLAAVDPEYMNKGVVAPILKFLMDAFTLNNIEYMETNLNLEDNIKIKSFWKYFNEREHKRRRSYYLNI